MDGGASYRDVFMRLPEVGGKERRNRSADRKLARMRADALVYHAGGNVGVPSWN